MTEYDVVVIGTGTAGQTAAYDLNSKGLNVAVVEKSDKPGGTCALAGCQAKKWFYEGVEVIAKSHHLAGKGILSGPHFAWADFLREKNKFTNTVPGNTLNGFKKADIEVISGAAHFLDEQTLGLDRAGLEHSRKGIIVNTRMQTTQTNICAIGDCAATIQLAREADYEAMVAASTILSEIDNGIELDIDYSAVPAILFTYPQYAMVGYTEDALKLEAIPY